MARVSREQAGTAHCTYCGQPIPGDRPAIERFGEPFCSVRHADEFAAGARAARVDAAARRTASEPGASSHSQHAPGRRSGTWIIGGVIAGILGVVLLWGNVAGAAAVPGAGFLVTALLLLACPLAMYFMMRGMGGMNHDASARPRDGRGTSERGPTDSTDRRRDE